MGSPTVKIEFPCRSTARHARAFSPAFAVWFFVDRAAVSRRKASGRQSRRGSRAGDRTGGQATGNPVTVATAALPTHTSDPSELIDDGLSKP